MSIMPEQKPICKMLRSVMRLDGEESQVSDKIAIAGQVLKGKLERGDKLEMPGQEPQLSLRSLWRLARGTKCQ